MTETSPRERRNQRTRRAILDAARELIVERGAAGLTLREVARRVDYSPAGIYEYFSSLDDIVVALCDEGFELFGTYLMRVPTTLPSTERIVELGMAYLDFASQHPDEFQLIFARLAGNVSTLDMLRQESPTYGMIWQAVADGIAAGAFHPRDGYGQEEMTYHCWATVHGLALLRVSFMRHVEQDINLTHRHILEELGHTLEG